MGAHVRELIEIHASNVSKCVYLNPDHVSSIEVHDSGTYVVKMGNGDEYITNCQALSQVLRHLECTDED